MVPVPKIPADLDGFRVEFFKETLRADVVLDRPSFNLISMAQRDQLRATFEALDDDPSVRVIVVRAVGEHFSSGSLMEGVMEAQSGQASRAAWNMAAPARCSKAVIAANRGYCFGAAFELSLACDFRIATETTLYALQKAGQVPSAAGSARLQKMVGIGRAKEIVMRCRVIDGVQAYDWGVATDFVVDSELESFTDDMVRELLELSPLAQRAAKRLLNDIPEEPPSPEE
ncbi:enoyl-CoA hydratase/isomerase family protein [Paraburkholderia sp. DHOC27]|uniref:enoyl-CoA hydratase/isomerase family protein n=1 Tax=Paraburkholderia sp. DHOC27 TaxID=2303330 RepID=UPI000E3D4CE9|nr:enoyl-CoA hydratase/isomerase family protein [Paraburkholderia sp. DHOC27]RFU45235.1 enoyl-CoA hydratase/isomerase family protein [Paraburkholderia sp. DHOC27]